MASSHSSAQIRLLLVEDVPQVSQYIRNLLAVQTQVKLLEVVTDGRQVLDQISELGPDVIIVDALLQGKVSAEKLRFLLNRSDATGGLSKDVVEQQFGRPADFSVVSDGVLVLEANNRAEPFVVTAPDAQISRDVMQIARSLAAAASPSAAARG